MSRAAVVQLTSSANIQNNLNKIESFFREAHDQDAHLIVLPENFAYMGMKEMDKLNIAETEGEGVIQQAISQLAKRYALWVIAGTIPIRTRNNRVRASSIVFDSQGRQVARYDKIHLFDVQVSEQEKHQESLTVEPGDQVITVDTPIGCVGLSVCYDLRFPELYQQLLLKGAEIFSIPSAFTAVTGAAHWEVLLRARAIENLCYVLAANQCSIHENGRHTHGHSMIVEPWGKILGERTDQEGVVVVDIDLQRLKHLRQQFPCNSHHVLNHINKE